MFAQSSQIVSKSRSWRRSAPQTLHRLRPPRMLPNELDGVDVSEVPRRRLLLLAASAASAAAFSSAMRSSSSTASASASGMSGIVSRDEMLGLRDRRLVGVEGTDEVEEAEWLG